MKTFKPLQKIYFSVRNAYHTGKGSNCLRRNNLAKGLEHLHKALFFSEQSGNSANIAFSHEILADGYLCAKEYQQAIYHAEQSRDYYEKFVHHSPNKLFTKRLHKIKQKLIKIKFQSAHSYENPSTP